MPRTVTGMATFQLLRVSTSICCMGYDSAGAASTGKPRAFQSGNPASVGTLLSRAQLAFRKEYATLWKWTKITIGIPAVGSMTNWRRSVLRAPGNRISAAAWRCLGSGGGGTSLGARRGAWVAGAPSRPASLSYGNPSDARIRCTSPNDWAAQRNSICRGSGRLSLCRRHVSRINQLYG